MRRRRCAHAANMSFAASDSNHSDGDRCSWFAFLMDSMKSARVTQSYLCVHTMSALVRGEIQ